MLGKIEEFRAIFEK